MFFWLFNACTAQDQSPADAVLMDEEDHHHHHPAASFLEEEEEEKLLIRPRCSKGEFSAPSDERNFGKAVVGTRTTGTRPTEQPPPQPAANKGSSHQSSSHSDDPTPLPAEPLHTFSRFFQTECVQECADANPDEDEDDSFLAVFHNPHFIAADRYERWPPQRRRSHFDLAEDDDEEDDVDENGNAVPRTRRTTLEGMTLRVHRARQSLPTSGYEVQWHVDPPQYTGLYRVQATVVRDRFETQYACSETGRPIEVHQEGERIEVARLVCFRLRPRVLQRQSDASWQQQYPPVARFLQTCPDGAQIEEYTYYDYNPYRHPHSYYTTRRGTVQPVSQLLLHDLYVHPDFRGGGLGLSLLDYACRKVGDTLALVVLGLPAAPPRMDPGPHDEPHEQDDRTDSGKDDNVVDDDDDETTNLEHYFGLLGFVSIHQNYMARASSRILLEEACPTAPVLDPARQEAY